MNERELVKASKFLSKALRHDPGALGLELSPGGWVGVDELLAACGRKGLRIGRADLEEVVRENDKQRFAFDETGTRIRANQGHSVEVDLELQPMTPPPVLYHGTAIRNREILEVEGLKRMKRHHVHLSSDVETAHKVGRRHGVPIIYAVDAGGMSRDGFTFYRSANGVWLVDSVPACYLRVHDSSGARAD